MSNHDLVILANVSCIARGPSLALWFGLISSPSNSGNQGTFPHSHHRHYPNRCGQRFPKLSRACWCVISNGSLCLSGSGQERHLEVGQRLITPRADSSQGHWIRWVVTVVTGYWLMVDLSRIKYIGLKVWIWLICFCHRGHSPCSVIAPTN